MQGKHYLRRAYESGQPIPKLFVHPRYWLQGSPIEHTNWQARYSDEKPYMYSAPTLVDSGGEILANLREWMESEELAHFDRQVKAEHQKLITTGQGHLELQALPIGLPNPRSQIYYNES